MIKEDAERWRLELLLPWYAAGTLSRSESDCVEKALAGDVELARRYALVLEELAETINLNEALGEPSASVAETLFAAIYVEEALHRSAPNNTAPRPRRRQPGQTSLNSARSSTAPSANSRHWGRRGGDPRVPVAVVSRRDSRLRDPLHRPRRYTNSNREI